MAVLELALMAFLKVQNAFKNGAYVGCFEFAYSWVRNFFVGDSGEAESSPLSAIILFFLLLNEFAKN